MSELADTTHATSPLPAGARAVDGPHRGSTFGTPGDLNIIGMRTLFMKEVRRFLKVPAQTTIAPVITTLIFLAIFSLALGRSERVIEGLPYLEFLAPGLIMMAVVQNAFANTTSSLIIAKVQGNIVDILMPPLGPGELVGAIIGGAVVRGLLVGVCVGVAMAPFVSMSIAHPALALLYVLLASTMLAALGFLCGLWAEKFDQTATITNFVVTPLSFLSGTFYSIKQLPEPALFIAHLNPFFYMIDGLRFAFTDHADGSVWLGLIILLATNAALLRACFVLVKRGYKLKA